MGAAVSDDLALGRGGALTREATRHKGEDPARKERKDRKAGIALSDLEVEIPNCIDILTPMDLGAYLSMCHQNPGIRLT